MDSEATYCSEAEKKCHYNLRNRKTVKYTTKKLCKKHKKLHIVKNCSNNVDNLIKNEQVYVSETSFSSQSIKPDLESQMLKLEISNVKSITKKTKKPKKAFTCENVLEDTTAFEDFVREFVGYLEELKKKSMDYKEMVCKQVQTDRGVKILSQEITVEDQMESLFALSESQVYLKWMMDRYT